MGSRTYQFLVIVFWLSTMTWLFVAKLLPELGRGDPPNYLAVQRQRGFNEPAICWNIYLNNELVGKAASKTFPGADGDAELRSRIQFTNLSLDRMGHSIVRLLLAPIFGDSRPFDLRIDSRVWLDPGDRLRAFEARAFVDDFSAALLSVDGQVVDDTLGMSYHVGPTGPSSAPPFSAIGQWTPVAGQWSIPLSERSSIDDEMSPRGYMPLLRLQQTWKVRQYSLFRPPGSPLAPTDVVEAMVQRREPILWDGHMADCWLVVYRRDSGSGSESADKPLGRMWVRCSDGLVLKQEVMVLDSPLRFERLSDVEAKDLAGLLEKNWSAHFGSVPTPKAHAAEPAMKTHDP